MLNVPPNQVLCVSPDVDPKALAAFIEDRGPIPLGVRWENETEFLARDRVENCTCQMIRCVCEKVVDHSKHCRYRRALFAPVAFPCDHGLDACSTCDPCTCLGQGVDPDLNARTYPPIGG